jgi:hypothetical protein
LASLWMRAVRLTTAARWRFLSSAERMTATTVQSGNRLKSPASSV